MSYQYQYSPQLKYCGTCGTYFTLLIFFNCYGNCRFQLESNLENARHNNNLRHPKRFLTLTFQLDKYFVRNIVVLKDCLPGRTEKKKQKTHLTVRLSSLFLSHQFKTTFFIGFE